MSPKLTKRMHIVRKLPARIRRYLERELTSKFSQTISLGSIVCSKLIQQPLISMLLPHENTFRIMRFHSASLYFLHTARLTSADQNDTNTLSVLIAFSCPKQNLLMIGSIQSSQSRICSSSSSTVFSDTLWWCLQCSSFDISTSFLRSAFR